MISEKDLENISSLVSLADAFFSCKPQKPCMIAESFTSGCSTAGGTQIHNSDSDSHKEMSVQTDENTKIDISASSPGSYTAANNAILTTDEKTCVSSATPAENTKNPSDAYDATASLQNIARKIASCTRCRLCGGRKNTVPGIGIPNPLVLVIGEGPGADEDATGEPFVGKAGQLLDKMLGAICLSRHTNCFIANIVKCRPPNNRDPMPDEADACRAFLDAQISVLKPKMILAVGRIAAQNILGTTTGINRLRGQFYEYKGIPLLPTYHPSALLRNEDMKRPAWEDLKMFRARLEEITGQSFTAATQTGRNG